MYVSHIISDVENLGPGKRICVWFCGCSKNCPGCCSPELQTYSGSIEISPEKLAEIVNCKLAFTGNTGITLSGGDPLEQKDIVAFLSLLNTRDVLVFTGYTYREILESNLYARIKEFVSAVKCGRYIRERDFGHPLMGSDNQEMIYSVPIYEKLFEDYIMSHSRETKRYLVNNKVFFTGLPKKEIELCTQSQPKHCPHGKKN